LHARLVSQRRREIAARSTIRVGLAGHQVPAPPLVLAQCERVGTCEAQGARVVIDEQLPAGTRRHPARRIECLCLSLAPPRVPEVDDRALNVQQVFLSEPDEAELEIRVRRSFELSHEPSARARIVHRRVHPEAHDEQCAQDDTAVRYECVSRA